MVYPTFKTIRERIPDATLYPTEIPAELKGTISEWFDSREVCAEDETFVRFFRRVLSRDFGRYDELLRIEPGYARYDWLVQNYNESQTRNTLNRTTEDHVTTTGSGNVATVHTETDTESGSRNGTASKSGSVESSGETETTHGHIVEVTGSDETTYGRHSTRTGSETHGSTGGEWSNTAETGDSKELTKDNPQSQSYPLPTFDIAGDYTNATGSADPQAADGDRLNWEYPGSQRETADVRRSGTKTGTNREDTVTYNNLKDQTGGKDTRETGSTTTNSGSDTVATSGTQTNTDTETRTETDSRTGSKNGQTTTATDNSSTQTQRANGVEEGQIRNISTGRSIDPATLLQNAIDFISVSSAWEWLKNRLSTCFLGMYDV